MAWHEKSTCCLVIGSVCLVSALVHLSEFTETESSTSDDGSSHCEFTSIVQVGVEVETANNRRAPLPETPRPKVAIADTGAFSPQKISKLQGHIAEAFSQQFVRFQHLPGVSWLNTNSTSVAGLTSTAGLARLISQARTRSLSLSLSESVVLVSVLTMMIVCLVSCILVRDSRPMPRNDRRTASPHPHHVPGTHSFLPSQQQLLAGRHSRMLPTPPSVRPSIFPADKLSFGIPPTAGRLSHAGKLSAPNLRTPSPQQLAHMHLSKAGLQQRVHICDADPAWSHVEPFFTIKAEDLHSVVEGEATGNFDIYFERGPIFAASVLPWGAAPRALLICSAERRGEPLASCAPTMSSYNGTSVEICSKLEIRGRDNTIWGTMSAQGADTYAVLSAHRRVLSLFGDQDTGRLIVKIPTDEVVAHAARDAAGQVLELGVRPEVDPILITICILAVVIFNPEEGFGNIQS